MKYLIVGAGWSGLAAAVTLAEGGHQVTLIEAAAEAGGRARDVRWQDITIDNGQHLFMGAYQHTLELLKTVGVAPEDVFKRQSLQISVHDHRYPPLKLNARKHFFWPMPLLLSLYQNIGIKQSLAAWRLMALVRRQKVPAAWSVDDLLSATRQSPRLINQLWEPLCLAMLNTPCESASARVFALVLKDTLLSARQHADLLLPKKTLGQMLPAAAISFIEQHGGALRRQTRVKQVVIDNQRFQGVIVNDDEYIPADGVILATDVSSAERLLSPYQQLPATTFHPIITLYLQYPSDIRAVEPMTAFSGQLAQWLFDRSDLKAGLMAVVISGPGPQTAMTNAELIRVICREAAPYLTQPSAEITDSRVIREKRATFACTPEFQSQRPQSETGIDGTWLAGDYISNDYPATLETAVINGLQAAHNAMQSAKR